MAEILINAEGVQSCVRYKSGKVCIWLDGVKEIREVPTHGDLIDKQAVVKQLSKAWNVDDDQDFANKSVWRIIEKEAPTIIEASKERKK